MIIANAITETDVTVDYIADASPLIYAAKANCLPVLTRVLGTVGLTPAVYREAITGGQKRGYPDAMRLEQAIADKKLLRLELIPAEQKLARALLASSNLGPGECETLAVGETRGLPVVLHDKKARRLAAVRGVETTQLPNILLVGLMRGLVNLAEFERTANRLAVAMGMDAAALLELKVLAGEITTRLMEGAPDGTDSAIESAA